MKKLLLAIIFLMALIPLWADGAWFVFTYGATNVTDSGATLNGRSTGGTASYFRYTSVPKPPIFCNDIYGSDMRYTPDLPGASTVSYTISGLKPSTTYYYCLISSDKEEISYGIGAVTGYVQSFKTLPCQTCPQTTVKTLSPVVLSPTTVTLRGEFGTTKESTAYFEYQKVEGGGGWIEVGKDDDDNPHPPNTYRKYSFFLKDLEPDTEYKYRAVVENEDGIFNGEEWTFKTFTEDEFGGGGTWIYQDPLGPSLECAQNPDSPGCDDTNNGCPPGTQGAPPNCVDIPPLDCGIGYTGTPPNCVPISGCPDGTTGIFPNCTPDCPNPGDCDPECPDGWTGTPPDCEPTECPDGWTGTPPDDCEPPDTPPGGGNNGGGGISFGNVNTGGGSGGGSGGGGGSSTGGSSGGGYGGGGAGGGGGGSSGGSGGGGSSSGGASSNDSDGDGLPNSIDNDDDNDGILDSSDSTPRGNGSTSNDLDGDGIPNSIDNDDDNDGIPDAVDNTPLGSGSNINDLDGDGINNLADDDVDGDGLPNNIDTDDDNDGAPDETDPTPRGGGSGLGTGTDKDSTTDAGGDVKGDSVINNESTENIFSLENEQNISVSSEIEAEQSKPRSLFGRLIQNIVNIFK